MSAPNQLRQSRFPLRASVSSSVKQGWHFITYLPAWGEKIHKTLSNASQWVDSPTSSTCLSLVCLILPHWTQSLPTCSLEQQIKERAMTEGEMSDGEWRGPRTGAPRGADEAWSSTVHQAAPPSPLRTHLSRPLIHPGYRTNWGPSHSSQGLTQGEGPTYLGYSFTFDCMCRQHPITCQSSVYQQLPQRAMSSHQPHQVSAGLLPLPGMPSFSLFTQLTPTVLQDSAPKIPVTMPSFSTSFSTPSLPALAQHG